MRVPVHLVAGYLGAGKTTTLLEILRQRSERVAVVVNDFGEAAIDPSLVRQRDGLSVAEIQGACVCCTAPDQFTATVLQLLETVCPDRILVEPTGLARPADLVDTLRRGQVAERVDVRGVIVVVDPRVFSVEDALHREQLEAADVVVINRTDLASEADVAALSRVLAGLWPSPRVVATTFGRVPADILDAAAAERGHAHDHDHASTDGWQSRSRRWDESFSHDRLIAGLRGSSVDRLKGFFRTDLGWWLIEVAGGELHARPSPHRGDSRVDIIARDLSAIAEAERAIEAAIGADATFGGLEVSVAGVKRIFTREELASLPDGIADVSALVAGRQGAAARLSSVFRAMSVVDGLVVAVASDGMVTAPAPWGDMADAVLVHSLDERPLPEKLGGPFRLLHPGGGPHGNVKGVVRIAVREP